MNVELKNQELSEGYSRILCVKSLRETGGNHKADTSCGEAFKTVEVWACLNANGKVPAEWKVEDNRERVTGARFLTR